jgi:crossover junction endodeoxyribonuclease RuvC
VTPEVIIGVDPSLRGTGYALLAYNRSHEKVLTYGVISNPAALTQSACLVAIHKAIDELIVEYRPSAMAIENVIYVQSYKTAIVLGAARGVAILAAASRGLAIHEYAPRKVKQAVVGRGGAQKAQVGFMVRALLGLSETPPADAADAIAIGLTHIQAVRSALRK